MQIFKTGYFLNDEWSRSDLVMDPDPASPKNLRIQSDLELEDFFVFSCNIFSDLYYKPVEKYPYSIFFKIPNFIMTSMKTKYSF